MSDLFATTEIGYWFSVKDGDPRAFDLFRRHYSYYTYADQRRRYGYRNRFLIIGPGKKLVLLTADGSALFGWRRGNDASQQTGVNCTVFRNEGALESSELILDAELCALSRWPDTVRFYTFVNPRKVRGNPPGNVFLRAGWKRVGLTKRRGYIILAKEVGRAERSAATLLRNVT